MPVVVIVPELVLTNVLPVLGEDIVIASACGCVTPGVPLPAALPLLGVVLAWRRRR